MVVLDFLVAEIRVLDIGAHAGILAFREPLVPGGSGIDGVSVFAVGKQVAEKFAFLCRNPPVVVRSRHIEFALRPAKRTPEMEGERVVDKVLDLHEFDRLVAVIFLQVQGVERLVGRVGHRSRRHVSAPVEIGEALVLEAGNRIRPLVHATAQERAVHLPAREIAVGVVAVQEVEVVVAQQEVRGAVFHLPHVAELVVAKVEPELLAKPEEVALLNADTPDEVVVAPLATRETETHRNRQGPVVARAHGRDIHAAVLLHGNARIAQEGLVTQKTFRLKHQVQVDVVALVEQEQLTDSHFLRLDMDPVQKIVGKLVVAGMHPRIVEGVTDLVANLVDAEHGGRIYGNIGRRIRRRIRHRFGSRPYRRK